MRRTTHLQNLDHLFQVHALRQCLHVNLFLLGVIAYIIVLDAFINTFAAYLAQAPPELDERVLVEHLVECHPGFVSAFALPLVVLPLKLFEVVAELGHGQ